MSAEVTIFVHGYRYNIAAGDDPEVQYRYWRNFVSTPIIEFVWQSWPPGGVFQAWTEGSWNTYHWAWKRAIKVASKLARQCEGHKSVDIVCHSLGSRVVYEAIRLAPGKIRKVLTLNGADSAKHARECLETNPALNPKIYCVMTQADSVLGVLGKTFTPVWGREHVVGFDGMGKPWPLGWREIDLGVSGDGPRWSDHEYSFKNPDFWPRWTDLLK